MAKAEIWIESKHKYVPYELPDGASLYEDDMEKKVACCICGEKVKFGDCFTSRHVHTKNGMGYAECGECYFGKHDVKEDENE